MKKKIYLLCLPVLILFVPVKILTQAPPYDSLVFDGQSSNTLFKGACVCTAKVIKCDGEARGYRMHKEINDICGLKDTSYKVIHSILTEGDEVLTGYDYDIHTEDGKLSIQLDNGVVITFAEHTKITLGGEYCCKKEVEYIIKKGVICFISKENDGITSKICRTSYSKFLDLFTTYTVEVTSEADILKVYEGSVEASLLHPDDSESEKLSEQMGQLSQDFQEGKISADELLNRSKEINEKIKYINEHTFPVNVEAGNKCTVTKNSLTVEPIESNDDRWWDK